MESGYQSQSGAGRTHLNQICGYRAYHALLWHDREWFEANSPRAPSYKPVTRKNWKQRDLELAELAKETAGDMISGPGRPVRALLQQPSLESWGYFPPIHKRPHFFH